MSCQWLRFGQGRHPPCGGCGLKLPAAKSAKRCDWSPSVWRVWIEIAGLALDQAGEQIVTLRVEGVD